MFTVAKGKSVKVQADPEDEEEKPTKDLIEKMKAELHKLNEKDEEENEEEQEEE